MRFLTPSGKRLRISKHAIERVQERVLPKITRKLVADAFEHGLPLTDKEREIMVARGLFKDIRYLDSVYKKWDGYTYVFVRTKASHTLVTVF